MRAVMMVAQMAAETASKMAVVSDAWKGSHWVVPRAVLMVADLAVSMAASTAASTDLYSAVLLVAWSAES